MLNNDPCARSCHIPLNILGNPLLAGRRKPNHQPDSSIAAELDVDAHGFLLRIHTTTTARSTASAISTTPVTSRKSSTSICGKKVARMLAASNGLACSAPARTLVAAGRGTRQSGRSVRTFLSQYYAARIQFDKCAIAPSPGTSKKKRPRREPRPLRGGRNVRTTVHQSPRERVAPAIMDRDIRKENGAGGGRRRRKVHHAVGAQTVGLIPRGSGAAHGPADGATGPSTSTIVNIVSGMRQS